MRDIKFRAWDKNNNKWLEIDENYGYFVINGEPYAIPAKQTASSGIDLCSPCQKEKGYDYFGSMGTNYFGDELVLIQYTGLKDKNGKEIYEGDIVNLKDGGEHFDYETGNNFIIVYDEIGFFIKDIDTDIAEEIEFNPLTGKHYCSAIRYNKQGDNRIYKKGKGIKGGRI